MPAATRGVSLADGTRPHSETPCARGPGTGIRFSTGFPNPLTHLRRVVGAPGAPRFFTRHAEPFDLCATLKARLLYLRAALSSHQSSVRKKSLSVPECTPALLVYVRRPLTLKP